MFSRNLHPMPLPGVIGRIVGDEAVLVITGKGEVKVLNEVGARVWSLSDGTRSICEIAEVVCSEFKVDSKVAEDDILAFVQQMFDRGVFTAVDLVAD